MSKVRAASRILREMASGPMDLKPARRLFRMWAAVTLIVIVNIGIAVIAGAWWSAAFSGVTLLFDLAMLRWSAIRLADAKRRQEKVDWERDMFEEWSR